MLKRQFGLVGAVLLCAVLMFSFVTYVSSQADFATLSDESMMQLVGGTKYKKGNLIQNGSGKFANCNYPTSCPTQSFTYKPRIYSCFTCYSGSTEYFKATVYKKIVSWCDNTIDSECPYDASASGRTSDCEVSLNTTC